MSKSAAALAAAASVTTLTADAARSSVAFCAAATAVSLAILMALINCVLFMLAVPVAPKSAAVFFKKSVIAAGLSIVLSTAAATVWLSEYLMMFSS